MSMQERVEVWWNSVKRFFSNRIIIGFAALSAAFWASVPLTPVDYRDAIIVTARILVVIGLMATAISYIRSALRTLSSGRYDAVTELVTGRVMFCLSFASATLYTVLWIMADRPPNWTNHPVLIFIIMWQIVGIVMELKAPMTESGRYNIRSRVVMIVAIVLSIIAAFSLGRVTGADNSASNLSFHAPMASYSCPDPNNAAIKGNIRTDGSKIFHVPSSRYYGITHPEECFATVREAQDAGYRPPG